LHPSVGLFSNQKNSLHSNQQSSGRFAGTVTKYSEPGLATSKVDPDEKRQAEEDPEAGLIISPQKRATLKKQKLKEMLL